MCFSMSYQRRDTDIHNLPRKKASRRMLRADLTPAEAELWVWLKRSKLEGRKFRRQHSVGPYILDLYCPAEQLAVELDGNVHFTGDAVARDRARRAYLESVGITVIRIENKRVFEDIEWVLDFIRGHFRGK